MNNLAFGSYYHTNSIVHKTDPRIKMISLIIMMVAIFVVKREQYGFYFLGGLALLAVILVILSKVPLKLYLKSLKQIMYLVVFSFVLQLLFNNSGEVLTTFDLHFGISNIIVALIIFVIYMLTKKFIKFKLLHLLITFGLMFGVLIFEPFIISYSLWNPTISIHQDGLDNGLFIILRVLVLIVYSTLLTLTTKPNDINIGLASLLSPLEKIGIRTSSLAMMVSLALRYIPTLFNETNKILKAQASRGVDFNEGSLKQRVGQIVSLLIPMFVISFKRADELADAMEARCYVPGAKRIELNELKLKASDFLFFFIVLLLLAGIILGRVFL